MTPNELTTLIAEPHQRQFDEPFKMMIFDRAMFWYQRLAKNTIDKDPRRRIEFMQSVQASMVKVSFPQCQDKIAETVLEIPDTLFANGIKFDFVGKVTGSLAFTRVTSPSNLEFFKHNKYQKGPFYSYINRKIQVYEPDIKFIRIEGLFLNLKKLSDCNSAIDFWNTDLVIPGDIMQLIIAAVEDSIKQDSIDTNRDEIKIAPEQT